MSGGEEVGQPPPQPPDAGPEADEIDEGALAAVAQATFPALSMSLADALTSGSSPDGGADGIEGLGEVMATLTAMQRQGESIELRQGTLLERVDALGATVLEARRANALELERLRQHLLEERKILALRSVFNAVVVSLDSLRGMQAGLDPAVDGRLGGQLELVTASLTNILQGLGFLEFKAPSGQPFDATWMVCLGFAEGPAGIVLACPRAGYRVGETVVRPAGVWVGSQQPLPGDNR
ncbi:MAG: nucleotide exchange factor GrpE [Pseudomonadota bacterium]